MVNVLAWFVVADAQRGCPWHPEKTAGLPILSSWKPVNGGATAWPAEPGATHPGRHRVSCRTLREPLPSQSAGLHLLSAARAPNGGRRWPRVLRSECGCELSMSSAPIYHVGVQTVNCLSFPTGIFDDWDDRDSGHRATLLSQNNAIAAQC